MSGTLVLAELSGGKVRKATLSAVTFAKQVGAPFAIVAMGAGAAQAAKDLTGFGAQKVLVVDDAALADYVCERFVPTVAKIAKDGGWDTVVVTASTFGKDLA
ncbi:MAG: electron transfer flavoprotein subunit alpha/FixB family protein, partial [Polyangiaceae bacterium]